MSSSEAALPSAARRSERSASADCLKGSEPWSGGIDRKAGALGVKRSTSRLKSAEGAGRTAESPMRRRRFGKLGPQASVVAKRRREAQEIGWWRVHHFAAARSDLPFVV